MDEGIAGFIWLDWVIEKLLSKHGVTPEEVEEAFSTRPYRVLRAPADKYRLYSRSSSGRYLFIVFAWEGDQVKIISARDMTLKERRFYARK
jgi:uncharacterized DUF497 family protein